MLLKVYMRQSLVVLYSATPNELIVAINEYPTVVTIDKL